MSVGAAVEESGAEPERWEGPAVGLRVESWMRHLQEPTNHSAALEEPPPLPSSGSGCRLVPLPSTGGRSALERGVEAAAAVDGFGTGRLHSLPAQLLATQRAAQPLVGRPVLFVEGRCRGEEGGGVTGCV